MPQALVRPGSTFFFATDGLGACCWMGGGGCTLTSDAHFQKAIAGRSTFSVEVQRVIGPLF